MPAVMPGCAAFCSRPARAMAPVRAAAATPAAEGALAAPAARPPAVRKLVRMVQQATDTSRRSRAPEPPGPLYLPFVGETPEMLEVGTLKFGLERRLKYGPIYKTSIFGQDVVQVADPDLYKAMMAEDTKLHTFEMTGAIAKLQTEFTKKVMANVDGARMPMRKVMLPSVTAEAMQGYLPKMVVISEALAEEWGKLPEFDTYEQARKAAMQFANNLMAGIEVKDEEDERQLRETLGVFFDGMMTFDIDLPGTPLNKALAAKDALVKRINASVEVQLNDILKEPTPTQPGKKARKNLLGNVIDGYRAEGLDVNVGAICDLALNVLQAATDTSAAGLSALLGVLVQRQDIWEQLQAEQAAAIKQHGPGMTKAAMDSCKLLDACVRETQRFAPTAAMQFRRALVDFELGGYLIKKGTMILINISTCQALEGDPHWIVRAKMARAEGKPMPIPLCADITRIAQGFDPSRWLTSDPSQRPTLMTFGHGPHTCLGIPIYVQEAKVLMACMLRKYNLELLGPSVEWQVMPVVRVAPNVRMRVVPMAQPLV